MQLLVCVIRAGSEYRAIVSHCGRRASDRWGKLPLSLDMIAAGAVCACVGEICVGVMAARLYRECALTLHAWVQAGDVLQKIVVNAKKMYK